MSTNRFLFLNILIKIFKDKIYNIIYKKWKEVIQYHQMKLIKS